MNTITFNDVELHLQEHSQHEFLLSNKEVATGYATSIQSLAQAKKNNSDELLENKHWIRLEVQTKGGKQKVIHWTKKGIVRLGFFIKSENAKKFRDWAEDYIVNTTQPQPTHHQIIGYKSQLSQRNKRIEFLEGQVATLQKMSENTTIETPVKVMELIDKGLKYDELNEKYKALDTQYSMFKIMGNEALNKIKNLQEQMNGAIPYLDNVLNNGMQRDKQLGWKPIES